MSKTFKEGICNEKSGFLFSHACKQMAELVCERCSKPVCSAHHRDHGGQSLCISCVRKEHASDHHDTHDDTYYDDPYFYGENNYEGYGNYWGAAAYQAVSRDDPNEFTEADGGDLIEEGGADFESDMSES